MVVRANNRYVELYQDSEDQNLASDAWHLIPIAESLEPYREFIGELLLRFDEGNVVVTFPMDLLLDSQAINPITSVVTGSVMFDVVRGSVTTLANNNRCNFYLALVAPTEEGDERIAMGAVYMADMTNLRRTFRVRF